MIGLLFNTSLPRDKNHKLNISGKFIVIFSIIYVKMNGVHIAIYGLGNKAENATPLITHIEMLAENIVTLIKI